MIGSNRVETWSKIVIAPNIIINHGWQEMARAAMLSPRLSSLYTSSSLLGGSTALRTRREIVMADIWRANGLYTREEREIKSYKYASVTTRS